MTDNKYKYNYVNNKYYLKNYCIIIVSQPGNVWLKNLLKLGKGLFISCEMGFDELFTGK